MMSKKDDLNPAGSQKAMAAAKRTKKAVRRPPSKAGVDEEMRRAMIAQAAYLRAEGRGFAPGGELDDWLEAEREVARIVQA